MADANTAKQERPKSKGGRPSSFTQEVADEICRRLYESEPNELPESLRAICRDESMPALSTVHKWLCDIKEFSEQYARARELRKSALVDRYLHLAESALKHAKGRPGTGEAGAKVAAIKLEMDAIKWILGKEYSREYGDKVTTEISGPEGGPIPIQPRERSAEEMRAFAEMLAAADRAARPPAE